MTKETDFTQLAFKKLTELRGHLNHDPSKNFCRDIISALEEFCTENPQNPSMSLQDKIFSLMLNNMIENKSDHLFHKLHRDVLNYSNAYVAILDNDSKFISLNNKYAKVIGYQDPGQVLGLSYDRFKCEAAEKACVFRDQDISVLTTHEPLFFLSYHRYSDDDWHLLHGEKTCVFNHEKKVIGTFSKSTDITESGFVDISRFLLKNSKKHFGKMAKEAFTFYITQEKDIFNLSRKEQEVLFYFIRGKTSQEIAQILSRSKHTIDMHVESIKNKLDVLNKSQLIEKAIIEGYMNKIPETLLREKIAPDFN
ncbi:MAG: LuxR C-terminal-related transcriptional regulator [Pseudomonadota bacterium]